MVEEFVYALRDRKTKKVARGVKSKGGAYYKRRSDCERRCLQFNSAHRQNKYEVGIYKIIDVTDESKQEDDK